MARRADLAWIGGICLWFLFQAFYRRMLGGSLGLDEAQIMLEGQRLALGYGPQPPLYPWLQWVFFRLIGDPILAMALLKNGLLAVTYLAVYALVRSARPPQEAGLAALGLLLLPQIAWESQRALTHSVLVTALAALTYLVFWTRVLHGAGRGWGTIGVLTGLGLLAKFNFIFVPPALLLVALSRPDWRARLSLRGVSLAVAIALGFLAAPLWWMFGHREWVMSSSYKLRQAGADEAWAAVAVSGVAAVAVAALSFVALAVLATALIRWRCREPGDKPRDGLRYYLGGAALSGLVVVLAVILISQSTGVKDRWMQPVLFAAGPALVLWLLSGVGARGRRVLGWTCGVLAGLVVLAMPVHNLYGERGKPARRTAPVAEIAGQIEAAYGDVERVLTDREWLAGNLAYRRPDWVVEPVLFVGLRGQGCGDALLVWMDDGPEAGAERAARLGARCGAEARLGPVERFAAPNPVQREVMFEVFAAELSLGGG